MVISKMRVENHQAIIALGGSIYLEDALCMRETILNLVENGACNIEVNMSAVGYIDSSGLGALVSVNKNLLRKGGSMKIVGIQGLVREVFELTRLDRVFAMEHCE